MSTYNMSDIVLCNFHNYVGTKGKYFLLPLFREKIQGLWEMLLLPQHPLQLNLPSWLWVNYYSANLCPVESFPLKPTNVELGPIFFWPNGTGGRSSSVCSLDLKKCALFLYSSFWKILTSLVRVIGSHYPSCLAPKEDTWRLTAWNRQQNQPAKLVSKDKCLVL